jgi:transposase
MAYREVTMLEVKEVLRLWLGGAPKKRIAAQLGLNVKTVRRYLGAARAGGLARESGLEARPEPAAVEGWDRAEHSNLMRGRRCGSCGGTLAPSASRCLQCGWAA